MTQPNAALALWLKTRPTMQEVDHKLSTYPLLIQQLLDLIESDPGTLKFQADKVLQTLSQTHPEAIIPYFDKIALNLHRPNRFIQWGAMITLANMVPFDQGRSFMTILPEVLAIVDSDSMISAANASKALLALIKVRPEYQTEFISHWIACEDRVYLHRGKPSPECRSIMIGHVLDFFLSLGEPTDCKKDMLDFAKRHLHDPRNKTAKKAHVFLDRYDSQMKK